MPQWNGFTEGEELMCKTLHSPYNGGTAQAGNLVNSVDDGCVSRLWAISAIQIISLSSCLFGKMQWQFQSKSKDSELVTGMVCGQPLAGRLQPRQPHSQLWRVIGSWPTNFGSKSKLLGYRNWWEGCLIQLEGDIPNYNSNRTHDGKSAPLGVPNS